ncbi:GDP-mannose 4,6-dehydratase [Aporhodopirellula aestuarii]|uniref:GDP-mannose 4,6-dehydratase n=1 Tax=Aporhodopirellula aestuarii TaxID=2950107 RepID=A0ABT0TXW7_9BACT|nr:GDP-mannose 4,6-dehydratase [Aporhodopirellula aestuarii]MCM2369219.1 GDP-mannose 4,6-dehydratase [Aporhodopirellula aestuarii]
MTSNFQLHSSNAPPPLALITGITGQDGSYLCELLLSKGYVVHGLVRRNSSTTRARLDPIFQDKEVYGKRLFLHYADLDDVTTIRRLLTKIQPDEIYHLAGQSHVGTSFEIPESTCEFTAMGTLKLLEIIRDLAKRPRFLQISSSEIFGRPTASPQNEHTPMRPVTPYGVAKAFATSMTCLYRESFDLFACNAICYNHESPRRGESFVTRKITQAAAAISVGLQDKLKMGSLDARRDWGYAPEYVVGMWQILQQNNPDDYVLATGVDHSVQEFLQTAFEAVGLDWKDHYEVDQRFIRPAEVNMLVGDPSKAWQRLGWKPQSDLASIVRSMVDADLLLINRNRFPNCAVASQAWTSPPNASSGKS